MAEYRIVQVADGVFNVEKAYRDTFKQWPWSKPVERCKWIVGAGLPDHALPFKTEAAAQKWIDDKRKYPIVIKHPA
jgi:hypothetical protein